MTWGYRYFRKPPYVVFKLRHIHDVASLMLVQFEFLSASKLSTHDVFMEPLVPWLRGFLQHDDQLLQCSAEVAACPGLAAANAATSAAGRCCCPAEIGWNMDETCEHWICGQLILLDPRYQRFDEEQRCFDIMILDMIVLIIIHKVIS